MQLPAKLTYCKEKHGWIGLLNIYTASHSKLRHDTELGFGTERRHFPLLALVTDGTSAAANGHKYEKNKETGGTGVLCDGVA